MKEVYITVTGTLYRYGTEMVEKGDILYLKKDTNNEYDTESIQVNHIPFGKIGYVANSVRTVIGECMSAGRLYDKIGQTAEAVVTFKSQDYIICKVVLDPSFSEVQVYQQDACNEKQPYGYFFIVFDNTKPMMNPTTEKITHANPISYIGNF